jgi:hypothetical protein
MSSETIGFGRFIKQYLSIFSDQSILSSIEIIDVKNRTILVRKDFWNITLGAIKNFSTYRNFGSIINILKLKWIERFCAVSESQMKKFFCGTMRNSFIDFLNVTRYINDVAMTDFDKFTATVKKATNSKHYRYAEIKGYKYYQYIKDNTPTSTSPPSEIESNAESIAESVDPIVSILTDNEPAHVHTFTPLENDFQEIGDDMGHLYDYIGHIDSAEHELFAPLPVVTEFGEMEVSRMEEFLSANSDFVEGQTFE